jgi:carboxypeptidase family protein
MFSSMRVGALLCCVLLAPSLLYAQAQASIAGIVRDTSGAVLPGVTVEAASPELIEKVRSAITDATGQYRIENLRPGAYTVTFSLAGFSTVRREGIELAGTATFNVNAELKVGTLEETITVTGESPIVDVQTARRESVVARDVITSLPTAGGYSSILSLAPGIVGGSQDIATGPCACTFSAHGALLAGRANEEGRTLLDGLLISVPQGSSSNYFSDSRNSQEISVTVGGALGETETGGPVLNMVPRTGGNRMTGSFYTGWGPESLQGTNLTDELKAAGATAPTPLIRNYDVSAAVGGPIRQDRLWFFGSTRRQGTAQLFDMYYNKNQGLANVWTYEPDFSHQAIIDRENHNFNLRLTSQLTPRNKLNVFWDEQFICKSCENGGQQALSAPESRSAGDQWPVQVGQISWTSPVNNQVLFELAYGSYRADWGGRQKDDPYTGDLIRMQEQCTAGCPANGNIAGLIYRSQSVDLFISGRNKNRIYNWRANMARVTGALSFKAGYQGNLLGDIRNSNRAPNNLQYRVNNGVPNQLTMFINNYPNDLWMRTDSLYVQGQWTRSRLTLQAALRYDKAWSWSPVQQVGPAEFFPNPVTYPKTPLVDSFNDLGPRVSVVYDLFGNGKTAVKGTFGRYLEAAFTGRRYAFANPTSRIPQSVSRAWTDADRDWVADCDLLNPNAQDLRAVGGDVCGAFSNRNFGNPNVFSNTVDPDIQHGWGVRPSDWNFGASVQHELIPRVSIDVGYVRRVFHGFNVTDNLAIGPNDVTEFYVTAPQDSRLPGGGGYQVNGLYDVNPNVFGQTNNFITSSDKYGNQYVFFNGVDFNANARLSQLTVQGGFNFGRTTSDSCEVRAKVPESALLDPYCHVVSGYLPYYKGLATYNIPKVDVQLGLTFLSKPGMVVSFAGTPTNGGHLRANYTVSNAAIAPILGRPLSGGAANATVNLIEPGTKYGERVNELHLRIAKILRFSGLRANVGMDIFNIINAAPGLSYNENFIANGPWLTPTTVMTARFAKFSAQIDF